MVSFVAEKPFFLRYIFVSAFEKMELDECFCLSTRSQILCFTSVWQQGRPADATEAAALGHAPQAATRQAMMLGRLIIYARYSLRSGIQWKRPINIIVSKQLVSFEPPMNFVQLSKVMKRTQFSCYGFMSTLHHVPLFMDGTWLLLEPVKNSVDVHLLLTRCIVIQLAMNRPRQVSIAINLVVVQST